MLHRFTTFIRSLVEIPNIFRQIEDQKVSWSGMVDQTIVQTELRVNFDNESLDELLEYKGHKTRPFQGFT